MLLFIVFLIFFSGGIIFLLPVKRQNKERRTFSILIACRNEENNITGLIESIKKINYPCTEFEVIIVDDASEDETWVILQKLSLSVPNIKIFRLENKSTEYKGKKAALKLASENAVNDYFLFTDADCRLPADVLNSYAKILSSDVNAAIGWYKTIDAPAWQRILDIFSAFVFSVTSYLRAPFSVSGMNWVIKKDAFQNVRGYSRIKNTVAGDDKLLLLLVKKLKGRIIFNYQCPVQTKLPEKFNIDRLKRKYGKFESSPVIIKIGFIGLTLLLLYLPIEIFCSGYQTLIFYTGGMYFLWFIILKRLRLKFKLIDVLLLPVLPYAILFLTIAGSLGNWSWKGQKSKLSN